MGLVAFISTKGEIVAYLGFRVKWRVLYSRILFFVFVFVVLCCSFFSTLHHEQIRPATRFEEVSIALTFHFVFLFLIFYFKFFYDRAVLTCVFFFPFLYPLWDAAGTWTKSFKVSLILSSFTLLSVYSLLIRDAFSPFLLFSFFVIFLIYVPVVY